MAAKNKPNEIYITRIYDAPVKMVWDAFTDDKQASKWWGPRGFTITTKSKELKPGGKWIYTMHGPDGVDYPNITTYHVVEKYSRLEYDHGGNEERQALFRMTVEFSEVPHGKTKMEITMALPTAEEAKQTKKFIKDVGGNSTWDRLAEYLAKEDKGQEKFFINRTFGANIDKVFSMWTNPEHFAKWLEPKGMEMKILSGQIAPDESVFYKMWSAEITMHGKINYLVVNKPSQLIYTQQFSDEKGNVSRHPLMPTWPELMKTTVLFAEESPNETRVTVEWEVAGHATSAEMAAFIKERSGMTQGWTGSFDKLEDLLGQS
jgi:uncharacterized protein YndB with AHSA1/START domain